MDFDAIRRVACSKAPAKKPDSKAVEPSKPTPPANNTSAPTPAPQPAGQSHRPGVYMGEFENLQGDPRFGYMEHSRTWKVGFHPDYSDNYSYQDRQGHTPVPQDYYRNTYGNPGITSRENYGEIGYYPDQSMGTRGMALPPPDRYMDDYYDHDHHHGSGQLSRERYAGGNHLSPRVREFGPGAYDPPAASPGPSRGVAQYYLPSTYGSCISDENPNACSIM